MVANAVVTDWPSGSANTGWPQEPTGMLMPGQVQGWPAGTQRAANAAERLLSQAVAWWDVGQYRDGDRFLRNRGTAGELLDLRLGSSIVANSNDPMYLAPERLGYAYCPGGNTNNMIVPDEAALKITGDIDLRVLAALDNAGNGSSNQFLLSKYGIGQISYALRVIPDGNPQFAWSANGTTEVLATASTTVTSFNGSRTWFRVTMDVDNGAGQYEVKFYTSTDGSTWTQLGTTVTGASTTSLYSGTAPVVLGAANVGASAATGKVYRGVIYSDLTETNKVLDIDCDAITSGSATTFTALTGQTVTINRPTTGRKTVAVPSRSRGGQPVMLLGTDDYLEVQDNWQHGLLNFGQGDSFTVLAVYRMANFTASQPIVAKRSGTSFLGNPGYILRNQGATPAIFQVDIGDGVSQSAGAGPSRSAMQVQVSTVTKAGAQQSLYVGSTSTTGTNQVGSLVTPSLFRIGRVVDNNTYGDMEFYGAAVFRRALSASEISTLSTFFSGRIA